ncbi:MAG: hypothetical protein CM15mP22_8370 [Gammaproteobacteria bacterium]|nr:MAG: hypothetical protein CM15mP22_8370 [Gammaproteobacteria bacterium]
MDLLSKTLIGVRPVVEGLVNQKQKNAPSISGLNYF